MYWGRRYYYYHKCIFCAGSGNAVVVVAHGNAMCQDNNNDLIRQLDDGTRTDTEIAAIVGCTRQNVNKARHKRGGRCSRCTWAWDWNPVGSDGLCALCRLELSGQRANALFGR
jgi:hypothetical protein